MALRWALHSACHILGYPNEQHADGVIKSRKPISEMEIKKENNNASVGFQMPLHYPRFKKDDYEKMEERRLDLLLSQYGLSFNGTLEEKKAFAMGAFLWPDQY